ANCLRKGGMIKANARLVLHKLATACDPPFPLLDTDTKIISAFKRQKQGKKTLAAEIEEYINQTTGDFFVTELDKDIEIVTKRDKDNRRQIINRLVKASKLRRASSRQGHYRLVDDDAPNIDWRNAPDETYELRWPFGLEVMLEFFPGNIAVVAGSKDAGKTAFLLELAHLNQANREIVYFSSEMGESELRRRLLYFDIPLDDWRCTFRERSVNFPDVIRPDALNIIDFLELSEDFYRISGILREIHDVLDQGVAVIALQKNPDRDTGLGGERSLEKARLYLAIDSNRHGGRLKIVSMKNWRGKRKPRGLAIDFRLVEGAKFIVDGDWYEAKK
ncbi:hypothetical protein ACFLT7_05420, partial [candidate division KSB1 bacterium]